MSEQDSEKAEKLKAIEAILMVSNEPLEDKMIAQVLEVPLEEVPSLIEEIQNEYCQNHGFEVIKIAGGYKIAASSKYFNFVERFVLEGSPTKISKAALETLAIIAYRQPVSKVQLNNIRGVNCDSVVKMLLERGYIEVKGRDPIVPNAILYGTSKLFLEKLGLNSINDLPPLSQFVPDEKVIEKLEKLLAPSLDE